MTSCSCDDTAPVHPTKALLFTQNTTRNPISWNPALRRPNPNEVLHAVHLALHRALDPCISGTGDACSWSVVKEEGDFIVSKEKSADGTRTPTENDYQRPAIALPARVLIVPKLSDLKFTPIGPKDTPEISVKLRLYGPHDKVDRKKHVDEALEALREATGFKEVDRLMIGFDAIRWAGGDEESASGFDEVDVLIKAGIWDHLSENPALKTIGVSDFSSFHLKRLLSQLPEGARKPKIDQLNFDRELPESLAILSKEQGVQLQSHSDNRVPYQGIEVLLAEFAKQLPLPPSFAENKEKGLPAINMHWVLKYTIILKDRGLVADQGFILSFSFN